jgi:hypothetical protein
MYCPNVRTGTNQSRTARATERENMICIGKPSESSGGNISPLTIMELLLLIKKYTKHSDVDLNAPIEVSLFDADDTNHPAVNKPAVLTMASGSPSVGRLLLHVGVSLGKGIEE